MMSRNALQRLLRLVRTLAVLLAGLSASAHAQWAVQSCSHKHRIPVTITSGSSGHSAETRIDLTSASFPASYNFTAAGNDVRVFAADDTTPINFVVTSWMPLSRTATIYVRLPAMAPLVSRQIYIYFGDTGISSAQSATAVFPTSGMRLHSKVSTADPTNAANALAAFAASPTTVSNSIRTSVTGLTNQALGGTNGNYGWCISAVLNVTPATAGIWEFRYGADFGRGGHLYVAGQQLDAQWNDDLWWGGSFANTSQTLEGSIYLAPGWYRYEALGFEGCCDGPVGFQARAPGGSWLDLSSTNFQLRASQCVADTATVVVAPTQTCPILIEASKSNTLDPASPSGFYVPGAIVRYQIGVINKGQPVDASTLVLTDILPSSLALVTAGPGVFEFSDGPIGSGLGFTYGGPASLTDSVEFSVDGIDFSYIPLSPVDGNVTHIRLRPIGSLNAVRASDTPSFTVTLLGQVK